MIKISDRSFFRQDAVSLAKSLLGKILIVKGNKTIKKCRIAETEAYGGITDKAAHSYNNRRTARTEVMYRDGGCIYIYLIYGIHYLLNIVANVIDVPEAVLIRAVKPLENFKGELNGPGKLTKWLNIDKTYNGIDLAASDEISLIDDGYRISKIAAAKRINIDYAGADKDRLWRFYINDDRSAE